MATTKQAAKKKPGRKPKGAKTISWKVPVLLLEKIDSEAASLGKDRTMMLETITEQYFSRRR
jgi:hypothetical protein